MDNQRAKGMLEETFMNRFDSERFIHFIKELFNKFEVCEKECGTEDIPKDFQDYIDSYSLFGRYEDSEGKFIDVLAIKLKKSSSMDLARTMQRNFVAKYLMQRSVNSALVAFYGEEIDNWRFSFVKLEYHLEKDEKGNIKPATSLTPPKRYSFLVGKTEPSHTAQSRFLDLLIREDTNPIVSEIEASFSVEKVTKEFFEKYKELYDKLEKAVNKVVKKDKILYKEFEEKGISTEDFSKKLLGQIVFIYFLQKKGWLGVQENKEWGEGDKKFLRSLFDKCILEKGNFFNDYLQKLFYNTLNNPRSNQTDPTYSNDFKCKIPFLNGGLFEPIGGYSWGDTRLELENNLFNGILEVFDTYNFTVKEDEPLEKEVAIDPEMLGKVFENLLEIKDRKSKGSYYTPREIVHYMCQESLINYLETESGIDRKEIERFIHDGEISGISKSIKENYILIDKLLKDIKVVDPAIGSGAFPVGMMMEIIRARTALTQFFSKKEKELRTAYELKRECIENSLYGVDIDPGAVDIAQLRLWLSLIVDEESMHKIKPLPNLDYKIMCGNSLLEEFEGIKLFDERLLGEFVKDNSFEIKQVGDRIKRLYQEFGEIQTGKRKDNGRNKEIRKEIKKLEKRKQELLLGPKKEVNHGNLDGTDKSLKESQKKLKELRRLQKEFLNEYNKSKKIEKRKDIEKLIWDLIDLTLKEQGTEEALKKLEIIKKTRSKPFFLWKLYFAEVFQEKGGFDVCIANPPYVRDEGIMDIKETLRKNYEVFTGNSDLYTYFYEKGILLLNSGGTLSFISSSKFMRARYGLKLRQYLKKRTRINKIIDFESKHLFEAITNTVVLILQKEVDESNTFIFGNDLGLSEPVKFNQIELNDDAWSIFDKKNMGIKNKIENKGLKLENYDVKINYGLIAGFNEAFVIDKETKDKLISLSQKNKSIIKPILRGRDIGRYSYLFKDFYLIAIPSGWTREKAKNNKISNKEAYEIFNKEFSGVAEHLEHIHELFKKGEIKAKGKGLYTRDNMGEYWWELRDCNYYNDFEQEKIIWIELTDSNKFAYSTLGEYLLAGAFMMTGEDLKYLLSFLNSKLCLFYFNMICNSSGMDTTQWKKFVMDRIPVIKIVKERQKPFIELVDKILNITKDGDYLENPKKQAKVKEYEKEIDKLVYKLYDLTPEEIKIVEDFNKE